VPEHGIEADAEDGREQEQGGGEQGVLGQAASAGFGWHGHQVAGCQEEEAAREGQGRARGTTSARSHAA